MSLIVETAPDVTISLYVVEARLRDWVDMLMESAFERLVYSNSKEFDCLR